MIRHEAKGRQARGGAFVGLTKHLLESGIIAGLLKERGPADGPVEDVENVTASGSTESAWHVGILVAEVGISRKKTPDPFLGTHRFLRI